MAQNVDSSATIPTMTQESATAVAQEPGSPGPAPAWNEAQTPAVAADGAARPSVACQTPPDPLPQQLQQHRHLLPLMHAQLARADAENGRLRRHLQLLSALFRALGDGADPQTTEPVPVQEPVRTAPRAEAVRVSRTYIRLHDLILEKRALLAEIEQLRSLNVQLSRRLSCQERRLSSVAAELQASWGLVARLRQQHAHLHTAESVLRYELREKRRLLGRLRGELEETRRRARVARQLNARCETEWHALRRELDLRKHAPPEHQQDATAADAQQPLLSDGSGEDTGLPQDAGPLDGSVVVPSQQMESSAESGGGVVPAPRWAGGQPSRDASEPRSPASTDTDTAYASLDIQRTPSDTEDALRTSPDVMESEPRNAQWSPTQEGDAALLTPPQSDDSRHTSEAHEALSSSPPSEELSPGLEHAETLTTFDERLAALLTGVGEETAAAEALEEAPAVVPPQGQRTAVSAAHGDRAPGALVTSVVAVSEPGDGSEEQTIAAPAAVLRMARAAALTSSGWLPDDAVSRTTGHLLAEAVALLRHTSDTDAGSGGGEAETELHTLEPTVAESDEAGSGAGAASIGCRLLSMLPGRLLQLRHERQRLSERAQQLQRSVSRLRAQRREHRRCARRQTAVCQQLQLRVHELETVLSEHQQQQQLEAVLSQHQQLETALSQQSGLAGGAASPASAEPASADCAPAEPISADCAPAGPTSADCAPAEPLSADCAPAGSASADCAPAGPTSADCAPPEPTSADCAPPEPTSADCAPAEPTSADCAPADAGVYEGRADSTSAGDSTPGSQH